MLNAFRLSLQTMKKTLFFACLVGFSTVTQAQHVCGTDDHYAHILRNHPDAKIEEIKANAEAKQYRERLLNEVQKRASYTVPVVFHVVHTGGPENISRDQILDQIRVLNEDFSYTNANKSKLRSDFTNLVGSADIKFELASRDPQGNCFDGVNRIYSPLHIDMDMNEEKVKDLIYWDYRKYLNVWVVTNITSGSSSGTVLGYAVFPWTSSFNKDGVVMRHDRVGTIGTAVASDQGRTLTHEIGHWLGLFHTFQGGCTGGDQCDDTPPVASTFTNANCPSNGNSCSTDNPDLPDMWENYMDYSRGSCMCAFTKDQISRMAYNIGRYRSNIYSTSNLIATGITKQTVKPRAEFSSNSRIVCVGQPITFYDLSCLGTVTSRVWTFEGANQTTFTEETPSVTYGEPGVYPVKLRAISPYGADEISRTDYITVYPAEGEEAPNTEEGFENGDPVQTSGYVHLSELPYRFNRTNIASFTGSYSFVAPITSQTPAGVVYSFQTPSFNIASMPVGQSPKFTFYASYAQPNANSSETLKLFISTDCGGTWNQVYQRSGTGLSYSVNAPYSSNWVPTEGSHWRRHGLASLASLGYGDAKSAIFRIDVLSDGGNPVFIDNINMGNWYAGFDQLKTDDININVFPNPADSKSQLSLEVKRVGINANIGLYDMTGREVKRIFNGTLANGLNKWDLDRENLQNGLYLIRVTTSMGTYTQTLIYGVK